MTAYVRDLDGGVMKDAMDLEIVDEDEYKCPFEKKIYSKHDKCHCKIKESVRHSNTYLNALKAGGVKFNELDGLRLAIH